MLLLNAEISASAQTIEEAAWTFGVHEAVAIFLLLMYIILFAIEAIGDVREAIADDREWKSRPTPSKIRVITKGIIGMTTVAYIVYLLITWSFWSGLTVVGVFILPPAFGMIFSFGLSLIYLFGYNFLYKPMAAFISYLKKKE